MSGPKVLRVGLLSPLGTLDPRAASHEMVLVLRQFLEPPFDLVPGTNDVGPVLFEGPLERVAGGGSGAVYRGRVREDVRFSDGVPLSAQIVAASLQGSVPVRDHAAVAADGRSVVFTLKHPNSHLAVSLMHAQSYVQRHVGSEIVGTGPFMLLPGHTPYELNLVKNPHFRRPVALDGVRFKVYPADAAGHPTALVEALRQGEVDLTTLLPRDAANQLSGVRKLVLPALSTAMLYLNVESPRLADVRLRRAIALSIDRGEFAADAYENPLAFTASSLLPRAMAAAHDGLEFDPSRARALLADAGQVPRELSLLLTWASRPYLPSPTRAVEMLARQLAGLGVTLQVMRTTTLNEYLSRTIEGRQDMTLAGWTADTMDPCDFLESCLASAHVPSAAAGSVGANVGRLRSGPMDEALADYRAERSPDRLDAVMREIAAAAPLVPLMHGCTCTVSSFRVANLKPSPLAFMDLSGLDLVD